MTRQPPLPPNGDGLDDGPSFVASDPTLASARAAVRKLGELIPLVGHGLSVYNAATDARQAAEREAEISVVVEALQAQVSVLGQRLDTLEANSDTTSDTAVRELIRDAAHGLQQNAQLRTHEIEVVLDSYLRLAIFIHLPANKHVPDLYFQPDLVEAFASIAQSHYERTTVVSKANRMRLSMADVTEDDDTKQIRLGSLAGENASAEEFWYKAFRAARQVDSRMVACLLLVQDPDPLPERGKQAHRKLLEYLTAEEPHPP